MCEPATLATALQFASLATTAGGALLSYQGQQTAEAQAKIAARSNAELAEKAADRELRRGQEQAERIGREARMMKGTQRATLASRGLDLADGSAGALLEQTDFFALQDQRTSIRNSQEDAASFRNQAAGYRSSANTSSYAGYGTLLGGAASVADKWYKYRG